MDQPSELELLILPYLSGEVSDEDRMRIEAEMARNADYARLVEEFRVTLSFFEMEEVHADTLALNGLENAIYRGIAEEQQRRRLPRWIESLRDVVHASRRARNAWAGTLAAAAMGLALALYFIGRGPVLVPFSPIALIQPSPRPVRTEAAQRRHERFLQTELERRLNEARLIQYGRGDTVAALSLYDQIVQKGPGSWASRVAETERTQILRTSSILLTNDDSHPLFAEAMQR